MYPIFFVFSPDLVFVLKTPNFPGLPKVPILPDFVGFFKGIVDFFWKDIRQSPEFWKKIGKPWNFLDQNFSIFFCQILLIPHFLLILKSLNFFQAGQILDKKNLDEKFLFFETPHRPKGQNLRRAFKNAVFEFLKKMKESFWNFFPLFFSPVMGIGVTPKRLSKKKGFRGFRGFKIGFKIGFHSLTLHPNKGISLSLLPKIFSELILRIYHISVQNVNRISISRL